MSSVAAQSLDGAHAALEEVSEVEATPRALLRAQVVVSVVHRLGPAGLADVEASVVVLAVEEAVVVVLGAAIVAVSEEVLVEDEEGVEVASAVAVVALGTRAPVATADHLTAHRPVLEAHAAAVVTAAVVMAATVVATVEVTGEATATEAAVTGVEVTADPAAPTTNPSAETATTIAIATVEAATATAAVMTRANARTKVTATTTGASAGGTKPPHRDSALRWVCHRFFLPFLHSTFFVIEGKTKNVFGSLQHWRVSRFTLAAAAVFLCRRTPYTEGIPI